MGKKINIYTDSKYSINCLKVWPIKWEKNNWTKKGDTQKGEIQNLDLIKRGYELCKQHKNVSLIHIKAHTGLTDELSKGNEGADALAELSLIG